MDNPLVAIVGTVEVVGAVELDIDDTTYSHVVIRDRRGELRCFATVRAVPGISQLVESEAIGLFVFSEGTAECRLWCVVCEDGRQAVDFGALRALAT
ncbi:MAG TPA: hypothetical protein VEK73_12290 [Xanthobacteraceae bacterium]|nr:hypothetical protein [Xanthobacteraceae bacterium]